MGIDRSMQFLFHFVGVLIEESFFAATAVDHLGYQVQLGLRLLSAFQNLLDPFYPIPFRVLLTAFFLQIDRAHGAIKRLLPGPINKRILGRMMRVEPLSASPRNRIVILHPLTRHLQVSLQPLDHLQVILRPSLGQLIDIDLLTDAQLVQPLLEELEVSHEFVLKLRVPVYLGHWDYVPVVGIDELAVDGARAQVLDVVQLELQCLVDPFQEVGFGDEVGGVHEAYHCLP